VIINNKKRGGRGGQGKKSITSLEEKTKIVSQKLMKNQ
jgi:hypothetical protein